MSSGFLIYADNEPKSVPARDLGDCRDNLRNSQSVFLIVFSIARPENNAKNSAPQSVNYCVTDFRRTPVRLQIRSL